jgi:Dyp-type peroxidase family
MRVEYHEIQGNVIYAYGNRYPVARYVLLRIRDGREDDARRAVAEWIDAVTFGKPIDEQPRVNLALTYPGLAALGVPQKQLDQFPRDFREGAWQRSEQLDGPAGRTDWESGIGSAHVLLSCHARDEPGLDRRVEELLSPSKAAFVTCNDQRAALLDRGSSGTADDEPSCTVHLSREHFGFADGCSQPAIEGVHTCAEDLRGSGVNARVPPSSRLGQFREDLFERYVVRRWRAIRAGEFLLGYENESGIHPAGSEPPLGPNGTFMVYRKLEQHVDSFQKHIANEAERLGFDYETLKSRIVGRWPDGTPLALRPAGRDEAVAVDRRLSNAFDYLDDPHGGQCPLGAHVRRTNPRSGLPGGGEVTMRHRIIRRGMPYGPPWPEPAPDGRGLIFISYGSSIAEGFETIQRLWCDDGEALGLGSKPDYLLQHRAMEGMDVGRNRDGKPSRIDPPAEPFVTVRGCAYLFVPSRRACAELRRLAS